MNGLRIEFLIAHIDLLTYISTHPGCEIPELSAHLGLSYSSVYDMVDDYVAQELVSRSRKEVMMLGGSKYEYTLTEKGEQIVEKMKKILNRAI